MSPKTWLPDWSHYPEQLTPLSATVWFEAIGHGIHESMRTLRGPFGGFEARTDAGWAYEGELEPEWEPEAGALRRAALDLPRVWDAELRPRAHAITAELHALRPERAGSPDVRSLFDRMWSLVLEQWVLHFLAVIPAQAGIEMAFDAYRDDQDKTDPLAPYRLLDGPNETMEADAALRHMADRARELDLADIVSAYPVEVVTDRLRELGSGREWLHELDAYLRHYGGRARLHELSLPREVEQPRMTFESLRLFLESGDRSAPTPTHVDGVPEASSALADMLSSARFCYALKENHVYHIDYPGLLATREVLLGFGRRLLAEGLLASTDDVWMLRRTELRDVLVGEGTPDLHPLIQERRSELADGLVRGPKPYLGDPPEERKRDALLEKFYGHGGGRGRPDFLQGEGASPGSAEGVARIVVGPDDFQRVRAGDVVVALTTTPAWTPLFSSLAALVTETGGVLSHAAIVAREYQLPAVVGAQGATRLIPDGARLLVDGAAGTVTVLTASGSGDSDGH